MDNLTCKECNESFSSTTTLNNNGLCNSCNHRKNPIIFDCKINSLHRKAIFNCENHCNGFVLDFNTNSKIDFKQNKKAYEISDISPNAQLVATITDTFNAKDRKLRVIDIATKQVVWQTNNFFTYEVLFTSIDDIIIVRAKIKSATKVFVFNYKNQEILYTFPREGPLEYGSINYENHSFTFPNFGKKGTIITVELNTLEVKTILMESYKVFQRVYQLDKKTCFAIDSKLDLIRIEDDQVVWKTKLDYDNSLFYAPHFFINQDKIIFTTPNYIDNGANIETDYRYFFCITIQDGVMRPIQIPLGTKIGEVMPFFDNCAIDNFGTIINLDNQKITVFPIEQYCR